MNLKLSQSEQEQYRRDGFIFPVSILDAAETADHRGKLEEIETKYELCWVHRFSYERYTKW